MKKLTIARLFVLTLSLFLVSCTSQEKKWHIGVSQCSEDIWRDKLNRELVIGGYVSDSVTLDFLSAEDNDQRQIEQIRHFIHERVDLLIVAPNSAERLTSVIDSAFDCGIPVILFDRKTTSDKYTAFMGADNYLVGKTMGQLIATHMGSKGTLVEITGLKGSSAAIERHRGFKDAIAAYPEIRLISSELGDWTQESGEKAMKDVLSCETDIDCVFGHNDRLALGARKVATARGINNIRYYGVDALPSPGGGVEAVKNGDLVATYIYPTQGVELMRLALKILQGEKYERTNLLQSAVVDKSNADLLLLQDKELQRTSSDLETIYAKLDVYFSQVNLQQKIIVACIIVIIIIIVLAVLAYRFYLAKVLVNEEVAKDVVAPADTPKSESPFLERFRSILQQNLSDADFNVERIGEEMGMSRVQLYRKIKSLTGTTPVELLRKARLARGRQMLETTDRSVSEIAYSTGFSAPSYFAKCFKDEYGVSPGEMRSEGSKKLP
ncbi:MAG: substrate-binding domain-containing protein [Prevotella sp.]